MKLLIVFFTLFLSFSSAANILVMLPYPFYSHTKNFMAVFKELAKRGHNMTVFSPYPQKESIPNWTDVPVRDIRNDLAASAGDVDLTKVTGFVYDLLWMWMMFPMLSETIIKEEPIQRLIKDTTSSFDLVITETYFAHEIFLAFGHKFNAPVININAAGVHPTLTYFTGNHYPTSYLPYLKFPYSDKMTFLERVHNTFFSMWDSYGMNLYFLPKLDSIMRKNFVYPGSEKLPHLSDLLRNTSLTLVESHLGLHYPRPLHNNLVEIGGVNMDNRETLSDDLQKYLDQSLNGFIYFSLGSHYKSTELRPNVMADIISAFTKVKINVLMKWENDTMPNQPKNIKLGKWFPQSSILSHPNCKMFVTHCGLHGVTEALYNGVPLVGIPLFGDQASNINFVEKIGAGISIPLDEMSDDKLFNAINKISTDNQFKVNAMKRKEILRDNPITVLNNSVFWVEYVIRHKGAPHLKPASVDLPWYKFFLVDVVPFLVLLLVFITLLVFTGLLLLFKFFKALLHVIFNK